MYGAEALREAARAAFTLSHFSTLTTHYSL